MDQDDVRDGKTGVNESRRKLIKAAAVAGGAVVAAGALPGEWKKPLATVGGVPAHAQTSEAPITIPDSSLVINTALGDARVANGFIAYPRASFDFIDPLCDIDDTATLWAQVGPCGDVEFKELRDYMNLAMTGGRCNGSVSFDFQPCLAGNGSLAIQLSRGSRQSNIVNASFSWGLVF